MSPAGLVPLLVDHLDDPSLDASAHIALLKIVKVRAAYRVLQLVLTLFSEAVGSMMIPSCSMSGHL